MKKILKITAISAILLMFIGSLTSCSGKEERLPPEQIASNLAQKGSIDPKHLIGEWDIVRFANTIDGNNISIGSAISINANLTIAVPVSLYYGCSTKKIDFMWFLSTTAGKINFCCSLLGNLIDITRGPGSMVFVMPPHETYDIEFAIANARSFVIKNNELMIYFRGDEKLWKDYFAIKEPKNLLILKRREP
ncbi:MAG: hypothetical protein FWC94_05430 [Bacteroidales bacterium]|nr:hypothetical protein [Bacteroidales bacterium]